MSYSNESGSSDSSRVSSGSSDSEASKPRNAIADINYELKPLSFSGYKHDHKDPNEFGVEITNFDPSKLSVKRNEENPCNWEFYDRGVFILKLKSFSGIIRRSQESERERYVKVKDRCLNKMIWEICNIVCQMIVIREKKEKGEDMRFCWFLEWCRVFINFLDGRPRMRKTHYFEDVCIVINRASFVGDDGCDLLLRLNTEMVAAKSMLFSS